VQLGAKRNLEELDRIARTLRIRIIETSHRTGTPHLGSCLSCVDILTALYFHVLKIDPSTPAAPQRDRFILSKGHGAPALFQVLAMRGFYPETLLENFGQDGSYFGEHPPTPAHLPGIEAATGSLGHGLSMAVGMALSARILRRNHRVFVLLSDGECNEGTVWEAAMFAAAQKIDRLAIIVDFNKWQATDRSDSVMALSPLVDKWLAFGWSACEVDGHDVPALVEVLSRLPDGSGKPVAIIASTIKGKGVSFMEDDNNWHYRIPTASEVASAKSELKVLA
jgi:transketolase